MNNKETSMYFEQFNELPRDEIFLLAVFVLYVWRVVGKLMLSRELVQKGEFGDEQAIQELIHLEMEGKGGMLLLASNAVHSNNISCEEGWIEYVAYPSAAFALRYQEVIEKVLISTQHSIQQEKMLIFKINEQADQILSSSLLEDEAQAMWILEDKVRRLRKLYHEVLAFRAKANFLH